MKKLYSTILVLTAMVVALSLTACGGDNDDEDSSEAKITNENIIGDWRSVTSQGYEIVLENGERKDNQERQYEYLHLNKESAILSPIYRERYRFRRCTSASWQAPISR